jgi:hypothetical protein
LVVLELFAVDVVLAEVFDVDLVVVQGVLVKGKV